jgi:hypothetical protein
VENDLLHCDEKGWIKLLWVRFQYQSLNVNSEEILCKLLNAWDEFCKKRGDYRPVMSIDRKNFDKVHNISAHSRCPV